MPDAPAPLPVTRDTPVGFELVGVKKKAAIQLMGSRLWGRFNPNHWDPVYAAETGVVREKTPKGDGFRFKVEIWAASEAGEVKTVGFVEVDVGV